MTSYIYYPDCADVGIGAAVEMRGHSFAVLADVTVDTTGAEGVLFKHGGAHGGHVLFIQDGRLHYVYNFLGEERSSWCPPRAQCRWADTCFGARYRADRNGGRTATPRWAMPPSTSTTTWSARSPT